MDNSCKLQAEAIVEPALSSYHRGDIEASADKATILVVDDTPTNLQLLVSMLAENGYKIRVATGGQQALESAQVSPPDLILLDVMMPGLDGFQVCRYLKTDARTHDTPIIFISALGQTEDKVRAFRYGGVDYITKPFQVDEVLARVETHLALRDARRRLEEKTRELAHVNAELDREIAERKQVDLALRRMNEELEARVEQRTKELSAANNDLWTEMVERQRAQEAVRESEALYRTLFDSANDSIMMLSGNRIVECNTQAAKMFACLREDLIGQTAQSLAARLQPDGSDAIEKVREKIHFLLQGQPQQFELECARHDGTSFAAEVSLNQVMLSGDRFYQAIIRDVTEHKKAKRQIHQLHDELLAAYDATLEGWSRALDLHDTETEGHSQRVSEMTVLLARAMNIAESEIVHARRGALLHDIGKMGIPDSILLKPGPLTDAEWEVMRRHPQYAYDLLSPIAYLRDGLAIPYCHHEKWDGSGYPHGLKGEEIPLVARIFAVVDVWDALRSDRTYRKAWTAEQAESYIRAQSGASFDPQVVQVFLKAVLGSS